MGVQASVSHDDVAAATAIYLTVVEIGGTVVSAISGAVWTANLPKKLALYLPPAAKADANLIFGNLTLAESNKTGGPKRVAINRNYQETLNILLFIAFCLSVPLIPLSLLMRNHKFDQMDQKAKGNVIGNGQQRRTAPAVLPAATPSSSRYAMRKLRRGIAQGGDKVSETTMAGTITMKRKKDDLLIKGSS